ncbi:MAG: nucleotidyl transferase AbiEii/AbiGii toxin family protein [Actinomycetota bacterium]
MDLDRALDVLRALHDEEAAYVLVGALALNLHGLPRATEDLDIFVRAESENIERVRKALRRVWDDPEIEDVSADDLGGDYPVIRYGPPGEDFVIDLISRLGEAMRFEDLMFETIVVNDVPVRIATPTTLYEMKRATMRPQDRADAAALKRRFDLQEED